MTIDVRPTTPADAAALAALSAASNDLRATPAHIAAHIAARAAFETPYLALVDGAPAGMACLHLLPCALDPTPYAELTELFVAEPYRRRGVGRALIRAVEGAARAGGAAELALVTTWRNTEVHAFYHALGYRLWCVSLRRGLH